MTTTLDTEHVQVEGLQVNTENIFSVDEPLITAAMAISRKIFPLFSKR